MGAARFILASIAIALVAAQNMTAPIVRNIDCNNAPAPSASMNYFAPSIECRATNPNVGTCYTTFGYCAANGTGCEDRGPCVQSLLICLDNIPSPATPETNTSAPCYRWNESLTNVRMYLDMGGDFSGSGLEGACRYAACVNVATAPLLNNSPCLSSIPASVCAAAPKAPPKFVLTFGGSWETILSTKADVIGHALQVGLGRLLEIPAYSIRVLSFKLGSLIVEFAVLDPNVNGTNVAAALQNAVGNTATVASAFAYLQTQAGFAIQLLAIGTSPDSSVTFAPTPAPTPTPDNTVAPTTVAPTPAPAGTPSSSASAVSAVVAVALVAMSLLF